MAASLRDASRIRIKHPNLDTDADGSVEDQSNAAYMCVTGNVSWSGFKRQSINTTCTETAADGWGNIVKTYRAGKFIDLGTLTMDVDFSPAVADKVNAAFRQTQNKNWRIEFPAESGETAGPVIVIPAHATDLTPITDVQAEGDNARSRATLVLKLAGDWTITDAT